MTTDKIKVTNDEACMERILTEAERLADYEKYGSKDSIRLRLLAEEAVGLVRGITGDIAAEIWFEGDSEVSRVCVKGKTEMDRAKFEELLSVSTTGENTLAKGVLGKLSEVMQLTFMSPGDLSKCAILNYGMMMPGPDEPDLYSFQMMQSNLWSLKQYRESLFDHREADEDNAQAWDELEKSIIGNLADDVQVGINHGTVELTIIRKLTRN
ncbi:MAG: hypothetical protein IJT16_01370 [Lachnospiraceae bacterium]|nr:hypothetical protein [Lachnospiraceae bacterium]